MHFSFPSRSTFFSNCHFDDVTGCILWRSEHDLFRSKSFSRGFGVSVQSLCHFTCPPSAFHDSFFFLFLSSFYPIYSTVFCFLLFFVLLISSGILPATSCTFRYVSPCYTPFLFFLHKKPEFGYHRHFLASSDQESFFYSASRDAMGSLSFSSFCLLTYLDHAGLPVVVFISFRLVLLG